MAAASLEHVAAINVIPVDSFNLLANVNIVLRSNFQALRNLNLSAGIFNETHKAFWTNTDESYRSLLDYLLKSVHYIGNSLPATSNSI